jgi:L-amino acid N-acyltransferase YncA
MGWHLTTGPDAGAWVARQINGSYQPGCVAIGLKRGDAFTAGVLYEQWNGRSIVAHIAVRGRMTPAFLAAIFDYPFKVCGAQKVICPIPSDNARSIRLATNMGFREEARIKDAAPTGDILLFTLAKSECRFLEDRYGQKCAYATART